MYTVEKVKYGYAIFKDGVRNDGKASRDKEEREVIAELLNLREKCLTK